jgi:hypothetical protein
LTPEVSTLLFEAEPRHPELHPRQRAFDDDAANSLIALGSFDALVAAVLLAGLSQAIASPELRRRALFIYGELQARLKRLPEMEGIYPELFTLVDLCCKHWVYLSDNQRLDVVIFWQGNQAKVDHQGSES